jgi:hypothetical protein
VPTPGEDREVIITGEWEYDYGSHSGFGFHSDEVPGLSGVRQLIGSWQNVRMVDDAHFMEEKDAGKVLSKASALLIFQDNHDGTFLVHKYDGHKISGVTVIKLETLNKYPNITEIALYGGARDSSLDLSNLRHAKKLDVENFSINNGDLTLWPGVEEIHLKHSKIESGVDCSKCHKLHTIIIESCDDISGVISGGAARPTAEIILPENVKVKINITGNWQSRSSLDETQRYYANLQNVEIVNDATVSVDYEDVFRNFHHNFSRHGNSAGNDYAKACETLGITPEAAKDKGSVNKAYRALMMRWHPDKNLDRNEEATKKSSEITGARDVIFKANRWN